MTDTREAFEEAREYIKAAYGDQFRSQALRIVDEMEELLLDNPGDMQGVICGYYERKTGSAPYDRPSGGYRARKARVVLICKDLLEGASPKARYMFGKDAARSAAFASELEAYQAHMEALGLSAATIETRLQRADVLFRYLETAGMADMASLDAAGLAGFVSWLDGRYTAVGKSNILYTVRNLFSCPQIAESLSFEPSGLLANLHTPKHNAVPSVFSADEVAATLASIDRETDAGRTLYLVVMLAAVYGLRSADIKELKIGDIDFAAETISIRQHKTGFPLVLPLVECVKLPLLDYLMNTRRDCGFDNVLVKHSGLAEPYSSRNHFGGALRGAMERSGVVIGGRKAGLHSLRHSLATGMHVSGVPANEIAAVLGHRSANSTKAYIWSSVDSLRAAALDVD